MLAYNKKMGGKLAYNKKMGGKQGPGPWYALYLLYLHG
jgi:hypothetical protein